MDRDLRKGDRRQRRRPADLPARHRGQALEISDMLIRSGALDVLVIDSVAASPRAPRSGGEMGDTHVGLQAR